ncbi:MAG: radical SAM protein [Thermovirgaceae bacterium]|nr:radical SAM protein [Synergistales bacterium]HPC75100.1 radical SAM protein [Synergistales bacterium]HRS48428.1 radical SAM protein [Thermovirgaceae bacterium]HRU90342.1 radical SAM protein [Thermovirgaceae bacterium]
MKPISWKSHRGNWKYLREQEVELDDLPRGGDPLWAMLYPARYEVGMANLGYQAIISEMRTLGVGVERFFAGRLSRLSVETERSISDFPLISASVAYEPDILTLLSIFREWGISPSSEERESQGQPVFGVGGALSYINPLVFSGMADYVVLGDGENVIVHLVREARQYMRNGDRSKFRRALAEHPSIYVPSLHDRIILRGGRVQKDRNIIDNLDDARGKSLWVAPSSVFGKTVLVELQRGCRRNCSFCTIPSSFGKPRNRSLKRVLEDIRSVSALEGVQVGFISPETGDYPALAELLSAVDSLGAVVSFASLRVDNISEAMIRSLERSGRHSLTVAPEAGNERLRRACGKPFSDDLILERLAMASRMGVRKVKLYFMMGLPGEVASDMDDIARLCGRVSRETGLQVSASVGVFVPKPMTFWEKAGMISGEEARSRKKSLRNLFHDGPGRGCRVSFQEPGEAAIEFAIAWKGLPCDDNLLSQPKGKASLPKPVQEQRDLLLEQLGLLGYH